jgi:hypothetical protein
MNSPIPNDNAKASYFLVALVAFLPRVLFILVAPENVGDGKTYSTVAENILSGCGVSMSPVESGKCIPHFGGNQGPGYPAFIATMWWLSQHSDLAVRIGQAGLYVASLVYLLHSIRQYTSSPKLVLFTGLVLALSPLQVAWPRYIFTETLALAGTLWLFAELIKSLHETKLRIVPIGIALVATTFIRLDGILLVIPVAATGFILHPPLEAIRRGVIIALILGLPWGGWIIRNINVGLDNILRPPAMGYNEDTKGYSRWGKTWTINQYQYTAIQWPLASREYHKIRVDELAYRTNKEKKNIQALLDELKDYNGKPFPKYIDDQFANIAIERIKTGPLTYYVFNPVKRMWVLWANVYDSFAWPIGLRQKLSPQDRLEIAKGGIQSKFFLLKKYPLQTSGKLLVNGWRLFLYLIFAVSLWRVYKNPEENYRNIMTLVLSFILARSIFSGLMNYTETRYTLTPMATLEMVAVMVIAQKYLPFIKNTKI